MHDSLRDPWVVGGLLLLGLLSLGAIQLYRSAPQTLADAGTRGLIAVRPSSFRPRMSRAEERLRVAQAAEAVGEDSAAVAGFEGAAEQAWAARGFADTSADTVAALQVWSRAMLGRAQVLLRTGVGPWWRRDDDERLRDALASVQGVESGAPDPEVRRQAALLRGEIERRLRPGPLEWLPGRR